MNGVDEVRCRLTALEAAAITRSVDIVKMLLSAGAEDRDNRAWKYARQHDQGNGTTSVLEKLLRPAKEIETSPQTQRYEGTWFDSDSDD